MLTIFVRGNSAIPSDTLARLQYYYVPSSRCHRLKLYVRSYVRDDKFGHLLNRNRQTIQRLICNLRE